MYFLRWAMNVIFSLSYLQDRPKTDVSRSWIRMSCGFERRQQRQDLGASVLPTIPSGFPTTTTQVAGERSAEDANLPSMTNPPRRNITHGVLSGRYYLGGRVETDTTAMAAARQEQACI